MTRKHFVAIAKSIKEIDNKKSRVAATHALCMALRAMSPKFNQPKFVSACLD